MARPRATTQFNFRVPNPLYAQVSTWATECEWAVNSELTAAVQFWARQAPEVRAAARGWTKAHEKDNGGRGLQWHRTNGPADGDLQARIDELEGRVAALSPAP